MMEKMKKITACFFIFALLVVSSVQAADTLQATIAWKNVDTTRKIQLEKGPAAAGPFSMLAQLYPNTTGYVDTTNAPGEKACYRMAYFDDTIIGPYSTPKCKTFSAAPTSPPSTITVK